MGAKSRKAFKNGNISVDIGVAPVSKPIKFNEKFDRVLEIFIFIFFKFSLSFPEFLVKQLMTK